MATVESPNRRSSPSPARRALLPASSNSRRDSPSSTRVVTGKIHKNTTPRKLRTKDALKLVRHVLDHNGKRSCYVDAQNFSQIIDCISRSVPNGKLEHVVVVMLETKLTDERGRFRKWLDFFEKLIGTRTLHPYVGEKAFHANRFRHLSRRSSPLAAAADDAPPGMRVREDTLVVFANMRRVERALTASSRRART